MQFEQRSICDNIFKNGTDYIYFQPSRVGSSAELREVLEAISPTINLLSERCSAVAATLICIHFLSPCGHNNLIQIPTYICPEVCWYFSEEICPSEWEQAKLLLPSTHGENFTLPDCNSTGEHLKFLNLSNDCCTNANVTIPSAGTLHVYI